MSSSPRAIVHVEPTATTATCPLLHDGRPVRFVVLATQYSTTQAQGLVNALLSGMDKDHVSGAYVTRANDTHLCHVVVVQSYATARFYPVARSDDSYVQTGDSTQTSRATATERLAAIPPEVLTSQLHLPADASQYAVLDMPGAGLSIRREALATLTLAKHYPTYFDLAASSSPSSPAIVVTTSGFQRTPLHRFHADRPTVLVLDTDAGCAYLADVPLDAATLQGAGHPDATMATVLLLTPDDVEPDRLLVRPYLSYMSDADADHLPDAALYRVLCPSSDLWDRARTTIHHVKYNSSMPMGVMRQSSSLRHSGDRFMTSAATTQVLMHSIVGY